MIRRPPRSTRTDTLFPYTTLFRSAKCSGVMPLLVLPHQTLFSVSASRTMNLSLAERPVCLPVATTSRPSLASLPSPLTRAASKSGAVPKFQCCTASLANPCFSSVTEDFAFTRVLPLIKNKLSDPIYHMIVQNEHRDLLSPAHVGCNSGR